MIFFINEQETSVENIIKNAIDNRNQLDIVYEGTNRRIAPYHLGHTKKGNYALMAYQFSGFTLTENNNFKILIVGKISKATIVEGSTFEIDPKYRPNGDEVVSIEYQINFN